MNPDVARHLWFTADFGRCFLIPERTVLMPGLDIIRDLRGAQRIVSLSALVPFACTRDEASAHLQAEWRASLASARRAWLDLYEFSQRSGHAMNLDAFGRQIREGLGLAGPEAERSLAAGQAFVESVVGAAQGSDHLSESEQKALFQRVFGQLPELLEQFDATNLARAAEHPEDWARALHDRVFGASDSRERERRRQELADDVRASIAARLREAGITPSADFADNERGGKG